MFISHLSFIKIFSRPPKIGFFFPADIYVNMAEGEDNETWVERITGLNFEEWKSKILFWKIFDVFKVSGNYHYVAN